MSLVSALLAFLTAYLCTPILRKVALRFNIVDSPEVRKLQKTPVPLLGGVAVFLGTVLGVAISRQPDFSVVVFLASAAFIFIISVIDDKRGLSARARMAAQLLAASALIFFGMRISFLPPGILGDAAEVLITLLWILGITNAFNYLDGLDALCSGLAAVSSSFFFLVLYATGQTELFFLPLVLGGACLGFMPHNLRRDKIFLGDAGSMFIGFMMAGIALLGNWASDNIIKVTVPILILGVPIFDMTFTTVMRYKEKKIRTIVEWLEYAGRDHFHHYLMDLGLHQHGAVLFILAVSVSLGINAFIVSRTTRPLSGVLAIAEGIIMFGLISVLMVLGRRLQKGQEVKDRMGI